MIPAIFDALMSPHGLVTLTFIMVSVIMAYWGHKGWETADSLRRLIAKSPPVCEVCAGRTRLIDHKKADHPFTPARLVYVPGTLGITGTAGHPSTQIEPPDQKG